MNGGPYRPQTEHQAPRPPSIFFDGTRLGLEGTMIATLAIAIPAGLHIGLSTTLGYLMRYADGLPEQAKTFSLFGFLFTALLGLVGLSMFMFFGNAIPTMLYSMGMVAYMLHWAGKRRRREKLVSTLIGAFLGLIVGLLATTLGYLIMDIRPGWSLYTTLLRWPAIVSVDGIALLWFTLNPLVQAGAGAQIGWRLGKQIEDITLYWFW